MMRCVSRSVDEPKPSGQALQRLVDVVAAGSRVIGVHVLAGSFSNDSYREELKATDGTRSQIVARRYADHGEPPRRKAIREFEPLGSSAIIRRFPRLNLCSTPTPRCSARLASSPASCPANSSRSSWHPGRGPRDAGPRPSSWHESMTWPSSRRPTTR